MINVKLVWETGFDSEEEINDFIDKIGEIHEERYCCLPIVAYSLKKHKKYVGALNKISIKKLNKNKTNGEL